jgi:hypothetical protein
MLGAGRWDCQLRTVRPDARHARKRWARFFRWINNNEIAAGVMPEIRLA